MNASNVIINGSAESTPPAPAPDAKPTSGTRRKPVRRVFGRRLVTVDGKLIRFEMQTDGLYVRHYHHRKVQHVPFASIMDLMKHQFVFKLE